jgi:hypothetical protein
VTAPDTGLAAPAANAASAEIIIIDCSGSMRSPRTKIEQARAATAAAVDVIRDGVAFAVIAGTEKAMPIFPLDYGLAIADDQTRYLAKQAVSGVLPRGGTAIGQWLRLASTMFGTHPAELRHAILLTDGQNAHETPEQPGEAIALCEGVFSCDCRGVGTDWEVSELPDLLRAARHRRHRARPRGSGRRLRRHDGKRHGQAGRRRVAAGVVAAPRDRPVHEAGLAGRRGPDQQAHPVRPAGRRLPDRRVGCWREPRLSPAASIEFPGYCRERWFRLSGQEMRIGRRSGSRGLEPEIDLTGPSADPGVSHLHAVLMAEPDGSWVVLDPGSANGTMVNGGEIPGGVRVPLHDGDRICVGAWTVLTIRTTPS